MGADDDLDGPTVATTGGPVGGAPVRSVRSEVLARSPIVATPSSRPQPPSVPQPDSMESTKLLRTDERLALAKAKTVLDATQTPARRASAPPPAPPDTHVGGTHPYLPPPPPRDASGRSIAPHAAPAPSSASTPPPWMAPMPPRLHTMLMSDAPPPPVPPAAREPLAPAVKVAIAVAAILLASIWIGSCLMLPSS